MNQTSPDLVAKAGGASVSDVLSGLVDGASLADDVRGVTDTGAADPISAAVVIGLGGSGIQTISRVRSAVRAERPDQAAASSIRFLGIDAVNEALQNPPLPPGVGLGANEFLNLTESPIDPASYIKSQLQHNTALQAWFDPSYPMPSGPQTEGLKRERMLGRLVFFKEFDRLTRAISTAVDKAVDIRRLNELGDLTTTGIPMVPVYIVSSSCGGTGSSGLLETLLAVWTAARARGVAPKIVLFTYLPGVFHSAVMKTPNGSIAAEAQRANAYAFFKELDHFLVRGDDFARRMGYDELAGGPEINELGLVHQVYLLDGTMEGVGVYNDIRDVYEVTAEAIFQFLLTDAGRPLVTVDAVNTDQALGQLDRWEKPRRYCSLGLARVVFPGDTYRRHLYMRYADWYVTAALLRQPTDLSELVRSGKIWEELETRLVGIVSGVRSVDVEEEVSELLAFAERVPGTLIEEPKSQEARRFRSRIDADSPEAVRSLRRSLQLQSQEVMRTLEGQLVTSVRQSGQGVPYNIEVLARARKLVDNRLKNASAASTSAETSAVAAATAVDELTDELAKAETRSIAERLLAAGGHLFGAAKTPQDIAKELGPALQHWAKSLLEVVYAEAERDFFEKAVASLVRHQNELEAAKQRLRGISERAKGAWESDELVGKDAGPVSTTTLIPLDAQPQVEDGQLPRAWYAKFTAEQAGTLEGEPLTRFLERWVETTEHRGYFSLGSSTKDESQSAATTLMTLLEGEGRAKAIMREDNGTQVPRLPQTLQEAAALCGEEDVLRQAVGNLEAMSRHVSWTWDQGRFALASAGDDGNRQPGAVPYVSSVILHDESAADLLTGTAQQKLVTMKDPERMIALSVEWAVPLHAVRPVQAWRSDYERLLRRRASSPKSEPPAHIHKDWYKPDQLSPLIPEYGDIDRTTDVLAAALVFNQVVKKPAGAALFMPGNRNPVTAVLEYKDRSYTGHVFIIEGDQIVGQRDVVNVGATWADLLTKIPGSQDLQSSIAECWDVAARLPHDVLKEALDEAIRLVTARQEDMTEPFAERAAAGDALDGLRRLASELRKSQT